MKWQYDVGGDWLACWLYCIICDPIKAPKLSLNDGPHGLLLDTIVWYVEALQ